MMRASAFRLSPLPLLLAAAMIAMAVFFAAGGSPAGAQQGTGPAGPPRDLELLLGVTSIEAEWREPAGNGGSPVTGYLIRWRDSDDAADAWKPSAEGEALAETARNHEITGLERSHYPRRGNGYLPLVRKSYVVEVAADSAGGPGGWTSLKSDDLASRSAPGTPQNLSASGEGQLAVTWDAPDSAGEREFINFRPGSTPSPPNPVVNGYYVRWREAVDGDEANPWLPSGFGNRITDFTENTTWTSSGPITTRTYATTYTITGLDNGKTYDVQVRAANDLNAVGAWSEGTFTPEFGPPTELVLRTGNLGAPFAENKGGLAIGATLDKPAPAGGLQVTLALDADDPGTAALNTDYTLNPTFTIPEGSRGSDVGTSIQVIDDAVNEPDETVNLTAATNIDGVTVTGVTVTIQDDEQSVQRPGQQFGGIVQQFGPRNLRAEPRDGLLTITFDPARDSTVHSYWLDWRTDDNPEWTTVQGITSPYVMDNLANGVLHHIRVSGISAVGFGYYDEATVSVAPRIFGPIPPNPGEMGLSISEADVQEGGGITVRATLHSPAPSAGVVVYMVAASGDPGSAVQNVDYTLPTPFVIPSGKREVMANIQTIDNEVNEADKTINLTAVTPDADLTVVPDPLVVTIRDNELDYPDTPSGHDRLRDNRKLRNLKVTPGDGEFTVEFDPPTATDGNRANLLQWRADGNPLWTTLQGVGSGHIVTSLVNGVTHYVRVTNIDATIGPWPKSWGGWVGGATTPNEPGTLTLRVDSRTVDEDAGTVAVTTAAVLDQPAEAGGLEVTLTAGGDGTATAGADFTLPDDFVITEGDTVRTVEIVIIDDGVDEGDETIVLSASTTPGFTVTGTSLTIVDDDTAGVTVAADTPLAVTEAEGDGHAATYTVVLDSEPTAGVTVTPTSDDPTAAVVSAALTFGPDNWDQPQTVTVTAVNDEDKTHETLSITHSVTSDDSSYNGISPSNDVVGVKTTDDDLPTLVWSYGSYTTTEQDGNFVFRPSVWIRNASPGENSFYIPMMITSESTATRSRDTCAEGSDYLYVSQQFSFNFSFRGSEAFFGTRITVCGDDVEESDETIIFRILPQPDSYTILGTGETVITVKDDDGAGGL